MGEFLEPLFASAIYDDILPYLSLTEIHAHDHWETMDIVQVQDTSPFSEQS